MHLLLPFGVYLLGADILGFQHRFGHQITGGGGVLPLNVTGAFSKKGVVRMESNVGIVCKIVGFDLHHEIAEILVGGGPSCVAYDTGTHHTGHAGQCRKIVAPFHGVVHQLGRRCIAADREGLGGGVKDDGTGIGHHIHKNAVVASIGDVDVGVHTKHAERDPVFFRKTG